MPAAVKTRKTGSANKSKSPYSVHPGVAAMQTWIRELKDKTGRSMEEWVRLQNTKGPATEAARRDWLKKEFGLGTNSAWVLAARSFGRGGEDDDPETYLASAVKYVEAMYAGKKASLRPIYDKLLALGLKTGTEARACPCQTMVPLYRNHVFAQIKPTTNTRIDLGFALAKSKGKLPVRLIPTGGLEKGDRITHRMEIMAVADINAGVTKWLKAAYDLDG